MDVVDAIMKIFMDIWALNNITGPIADIMGTVMTGFFKGIVALVEMIKKMYEVMGAQ